jgi:hypothetical protein
MICGYAYRQKHEWKPIDEADRMPTTATKTQLRHYDTGFMENLFHTFVSTANLRDGLLSWTVGWKGIDEVGTTSGWIGCGITTNSSASINLYDASAAGIATKNSWNIYARAGSWMSVKICHAGGSIEVTPSTDFPVSTANRTLEDDGFKAEHYMEFAADPETMRIIARSSTDKYGVVLHTAATKNEFESLRPCVSVAGRLEACLLSNPDE